MLGALHFVSQTHAFRNGQRVGRRYRILNEIAQGGHACVYLAYDKHLGREVAIKVLMPHLRRTDMARRFAREARILSRLKSPHIIGVQDSGWYWGVPWLVMSYIPGSVDLHVLISQYRAQGLHVPLPVVASILRGIAHGIDHMHRADVVHRDLKPSNILVQLEPEVHATIIDLGLAHDVTAASQYTATGIVLGTLDYLAPEISAKKRGDSRSDIFSFGVFAYELVAGQSPGNLYPLALPSISRPQAVPLDEVIMCALARDPDERFQSGSELREALEDALFTPSWPTNDEDDETETLPQTPPVISGACKTSHGSLDLDSCGDEQMVWASEVPQRDSPRVSRAKWAIGASAVALFASAAAVYQTKQVSFVTTSDNKEPITHDDPGNSDFVGPPAPLPAAEPSTFPNKIAKATQRPPKTRRAKPRARPKKRETAKAPVTPSVSGDDEGAKKLEDDSKKESVTYLIGDHELTVPKGTNIEVTIE